jgi:hypothetical protein
MTDGEEKTLSVLDKENHEGDRSEINTNCRGLVCFKTYIVDKIRDAVRKERHGSVCNIS